MAFWRKFLTFQIPLMRSRKSLFALKIVPRDECWMSDLQGPTVTVPSQPSGGLRRARTIDLVWYAMGGVGTGLVYVFLLRFAGSFFETYLGISPEKVGILVLVPRLLDAFTDPISGAWLDAHNSKYGKFRPYIQCGAYLMACSLVFIFIDWGQTPFVTLVLAYVFYIANQLIWDVVEVPYLASLPVLTQDPKQRVLAVSLKFTFTSLLIIPVMAAVGAVIKHNAETSSHINVYLYVAILLGVLLVGAMTLVARSLKPYDTKEFWASLPVQPEQKMGFKRSALAVIRNKPLLLLMLSTGSDFLAFGASNNALVYYFRFNVGDASQIGIYSLVTGIVWIGGFLCVTPIANYFGRKNTYITISLLNVIACLSLLLVPYDNMTLIILQGSVSVFFQAFSAVLLWSILSDCIDYDFWKNGERSEGIATSMIGFVNKFGSSFGASIFYGIVVPAGYIAVTKEMPEPVQPPSAKFAITAVLSILPALAFTCSFVAFLFFPLDNRTLARMHAELYRKKEDTIGPEGSLAAPLN